MHGPTQRGTMHSCLDTERLRRDVQNEWLSKPYLDDRKARECEHNTVNVVVMTVQKPNALQVHYK